MNNYTRSLTRLGFAAALTVLGACSPGSVAVTEPTPTSSSDEQQKKGNL